MIKRPVRRPTLYYFESDVGCGIRAAQNIIHARANLRREMGDAFRPRLRRATEHDYNWVKTMGGYLPDGVTK